MYLRIEINGELFDLMQKVWPNKDESKLYHDCENVYEWVWVSLPEYKIWLNVSREHEQGKEQQNYPTYIRSFDSDAVFSKRVERIPSEVPAIISKALQCKVVVHEGNHIIDRPEGNVLNEFSP